MTPTTEDVRFIWIVSQTGCTARAEFDAWLLRVQAEAWEAGYADGVYGRTGLDVTPNPYTLTTEV